MDVTAIKKPYALFLGDVRIPEDAKTAYGLAYWRPEWCIAQIRMRDCRADTGLPDMDVDEAVRKGAKSLLIGVTPTGGRLSEAWIDSIVRALEAGLDVVSGLHQRLDEIPEIVACANRHNRSLFDVRKPSTTFAPGSPIKRSGNRLLTIGTDMCVGKKYTALSLHREMSRRGLNSTFCATGQTGILIAERGVAIDTVTSDFIAGAVEWLSPAQPDDHWHVIEGQGSLFHPSSGITLGLLYGSQPDALVLCHAHGRETILDWKQVKIPSLKDCVDLYLRCARLSNPRATLVGISLNTSNIDPDERSRVIDAYEDEMRVVCVDPLNTGVGRIVDGLFVHPVHSPAGIG